MRYSLNIGIQLPYRLDADYTYFLYQYNGEKCKQGHFQIVLIFWLTSIAYKRIFT